MGQAPGPLRPSKTAYILSDGTLIRHASRAPRSLGDAAPSSNAVTEVPALVFNDAALDRFLHSVAWARAAQNHVKLVWRRDNSSAVLNAIYAAMPWKGEPGTAEIDTGNPSAITAEAETIIDSLYESFFDHAGRGAHSVAKFLAGEQEIRDYAVKAVRDVFADAQRLNAAILGEVQRSIAALATIKCASTIGLKTTAALAGGAVPLAASFAITTGYGLTLAMITDWGKAGLGRAVGLQLGSAVGKTAAKRAAAKIAAIYADEATVPARRAEWLAKRTAAMERKLAAGGTPGALRKLARDTRRLAAAEDAAASARRGAQILGAVRWLFLAADIAAAANTWRGDMRAAGYAL